MIKIVSPCYGTIYVNPVPRNDYHQIRIVKGYSEQSNEITYMDESGNYHSQLLETFLDATGNWNCVFTPKIRLY